MADVELLPLPAIERWKVTGDYAFPTATDPEGHAVDYDAHVEAMQSYARACVEANLAPLRAENERLRAEVERLRRELDDAAVALIAACQGLAEFEGFERAQHEAFNRAEAACRKAIDGIKGDSNG